MKRIMIILLAAIIPFTAFCQIPKMPETMLSPNAASLGEYGDVPVSLFTGIPRIEIPIYELKAGNYKLPLSMSYHAGGVRPDQHPGWTGSGWTLMAGGCISRVANDMVDEYHNADNRTISPYFKYMGFLYQYARLDQAQWNNSNFLKAFLDVTARPGYAEYDTEPDNFSFNFCGYSGSFYLNHKGEWQVQCDKPLKVIFENKPENFTLLYGRESPSFRATGTDMANSAMGASHMFKKFTIIAEDGTQYIFGEDDNAIEYSVPFFEQIEKRLQATTWNLTKIILPNDKTIKFTYERGDFIAQMFLSVSETISYKVMAKDGIWEPISPCSFKTMPSLTKGNNGQLILPSYLKLIEGGDARVEFSRNQSTELEYNFRELCQYNETFFDGKFDQFLPILQYNGKYDEEINYPNCLNGIKYYQLNEIKIKDPGSDYGVSYGFNYSESPNSRLMLESITESNGSSRGKIYRFEYDSPGLLPVYVSNKTDHCGFYNNRYADYSDLDLYPDYREPNEVVATYGTLNKITYPTGGYSRFVFEPHDYSKSVSEDRTACNYMFHTIKSGGIRIKEIITSPTGMQNDEYISRKYLYVINYLFNKENASESSGVLGALAKYRFDYIVSSPTGGFNTRMDIFSSQSVLPGTTNACGSHIGYSEVIEKYPDGSFSRYKYTNFDDGHTDQRFDATLQESRSLYEPYSSKEQERGLLKTKEDYNSNFKLTHSISYEYEKDTDGSDYVRAVKSSHSKQCPQAAEGYLEGTVYRLYTYLMRKKKEIISVYEPENTRPGTTTLEYRYNTDKLTSETKRTGSNNEIYTSYYKYPCNYSTDECGLMRDRHLLNNLIEKSETVKKSGSTAETELEKLQLRYDKGIYVPSDLYVSAKGSPLMEKAHYEYDSRHNLIYVIENKTKHTVYLWGYNSQYPVAEIKNATLSEVKGIIGDIDAFSSQAKPDFAKIGKLRQLLTNSQISTYAYKPLTGLTYKTDPNGNTTYFEYDPLGRLSCIKDTNGNILETYKYNYSSK